MTARIMRKHTAKRRAFAHRPSPIRITSLLREVADRLNTTAPDFIIARRVGFVNFGRACAPYVEACRFLSENKSAGAIDKPARRE